MVIGTKVQEKDTGRTGTTASEIKLVEWDWCLAVLWDDGQMESEVPEFDLIAIAAQIDVKAVNFESDARYAGWSALARNAGEHALVSARNMEGNEIYLYFTEGRFNYTASYAVKNGRRIKVRNVSEAKRLLSKI